MQSIDMPRPSFREPFASCHDVIGFRFFWAERFRVKGQGVSFQSPELYSPKRWGGGGGTEGLAISEVSLHKSLIVNLLNVY